MTSKDDDQAPIRAAIRQRRRALGMTQVDVARLLSVSRLTYHRMENGPRHIRFAEIAVLCAQFHCDVGELVQDKHLAAAYKGAMAILGIR